jgi:lysozyme family protein
MTADELIDGILEREGGYTEHPSDRGGPTNFGVTAGVLGEWRHLGRQATREVVKTLTVDDARIIYQTRYLEPFLWVPFEELRIQLVDFGVNAGVGTAIKALQHILHVPEDGIAGDRTQRALKEWPWFLTHNALVAARLRHYLGVVARDKTQQPFLPGWLRRAMRFYV